MRFMIIDTCEIIMNIITHVRLSILVVAEKSINLSILDNKRIQTWFVVVVDCYWNRLNQSYFKISNHFQRET